MKELDKTEETNTREKKPTVEENFCKLYSDFHGEKIDNVKQIALASFNGEDLLDFCEEYKNLCFQEAIKKIEGKKSNRKGSEVSDRGLERSIEILKEEINGR